MRIIEYIDCHQIVVEFQDEYKTKINTTYQMFNNGTVKIHIVQRFTMLELLVLNIQEA